MTRVWFAGAAWLPSPVLALDLEAISRGLVEADPWGQNADMLPWLLGWLGVTLLVAVAAKLIYTVIDQWRSDRRSRRAARHNTDEWILEVGDLLNVPAPRNLKPGATPAAWHQYRHKVKLALLSELQRGRQLAARVAELERH